MAWNHIAHNLSVEPKDLLEVYRGSNSPGEFHNAIIKLKRPNETRGRIKKVNEESSQTSSLTRPETAESEVPDSVDVTENNKEEIDAEHKSIRGFEDEINRLRSELDAKNKQIEDLERTCGKMRSVIEEKEETLSAIRQGLERVRSMAEDNASLWEILEVLEDLYSTI